VIASDAVVALASWAKTAKVAHEKELARLEKERVADLERKAEEEKERIRNTMPHLGLRSERGLSQPSETRREDDWNDEEDEGEGEDEGMGYVSNKYEDSGYVSNKYTDSGTPPYSPFDREEVEQGIVEND
jgi:hypothetical protein